jgi:flavin reductase (DIM6/NTAB) family NADH-FMN oxidoreductase RutF
VTDPAIDHVTIEPSVLYFGTPVALLSTENPDGSFNLAPMSSAWALDKVIVLGLGEEGQSARNLAERPELVINLPAPHQWEAVERLAPLTGLDPVPAHKPRHRYHADKFGAGELSPLPSEVVAPERVAECPVQLEAEVVALHEPREGGFAIVETQVRRVHAAEELVIPGTHHVDTSRWRPLFYVFRHYFGLGDRLGRNFRAEY